MSFSLPNGLAGGGKKEGLYVWKKIEKKEDIEVTAISVSSEGLTLTLNTAPGSAAALDGMKMKLVQKFPSFAAETTGTYTFDGTRKYANYTGTGNYGGNFTLSSRTLKILNSNASGLSYLVASPITFEPKLIGYVISDDSNAYPDGGSKGGYYYEKMQDGIPLGLFGCSKFAVDNFIQTNNALIYNTPVRHSLGIKPSRLLIMAEYFGTDSGSKSFAIEVYGTANANFGAQDIGTLLRSRNNYGGTGIGTDSSFRITADASSINIPASSYYFKAGVKYTLITMA